MTPRVLRGRDDFGRPIVRQELSNRPGVFAVVDEADYQRLTERGISTTWILNSNGQGQHYVRCYLPSVAGALGQVARIILEPGNGRRVRYANSDRLDLRRCNIRVEDGYAPGQTATVDEFSTPPAARKGPHPKAADLGSPMRTGY